MRSAPQTFARKEEAERYLTLVEAQLMRGEWMDAQKAKVTIEEYGRQWITQRPNLRPRTSQLYTWIFNRHIVPYLGKVSVGSLTAPMVRNWRSRLLDEGVSVGQAAKAYRLLRAVLNTAVREDELIRANPCRIPGADQERSLERPTLTPPQVFALAARVPDRYRALLLVATFASLRWGEVTALRRSDVDLPVGTVRVREAFSEQRGIGLVLGPPKSRAGVRTVALPPTVLPDLQKHVDSFVGQNHDSFVFTTPSGKPIWRGNFNKLVDWRRITAEVGAPGLHFHDLRHTGNVFASRTGANLRDLMTRMGHDSPRAALIYLHANPDADRAIAEAVGNHLNSVIGDLNDRAEKE